MDIQIIQNKIYKIRGQRVMLDFDLAELYQVETKRLKDSVRRNIDRFEGVDFMFEILNEAFNSLKDSLRSQIVTGCLRRLNIFLFCRQHLLKKALLIIRSLENKNRYEYSYRFFVIPLFLQDGGMAHILNDDAFVKYLIG